MFCTNCGANISENEKFCTNCGARQVVEETVKEMANAGVNVQGAQVADINEDVYAQAEMSGTNEQGQTVHDFEQAVDTDMPIEKPKKKKGFKKKAIIAAVVAGSLVVTSGLAALISPTVRNTFARTFMSDQKYFRHVQKKNAEKFSKQFAAAIAAYEKLLDGNSVAEADVELILEKEGLQFIAEKGGAEAAEVLGKIQDLSVSYGVEGNAKGFALDAACKMNGTTLANAEVIADMEGGNLYLRLPDLSSKALRYNFSEEMDMQAFGQGVGMIKKVLEVVPEQAVLERIVSRYWTCIAESVTDVDESSVTLKAGDVSQKCVQQKVKVTQKLALNVCKAVLKEAKSDGDLKKIIMDAAGAVGGNPESTYDEFKNGIEMMLKGMGSAKASSESVGNLKFWVDGEGMLIGAGFEMNEKQGDGEFAIYTLEKGKKFGTAAIIEADGKKISLEGGGTISGGKRNGSYKLNVFGTEYVEISFADIDEEKWEKGWLDGKVTIAPTEASTALMKAAANGEMAELLDGLKIEISGTQSSDTEMEGTATYYLANRRFITLKASSKLADRAFALPDPSGRFIDADDKDAMEDWGKDCLNALEANMRNAGLPIPEEAESEVVTEAGMEGETANGVEIATAKEPAEVMPQNFGIGRVIQ